MRKNHRARGIFIWWHLIQNTEETRKQRKYAESTKISSSKDYMEKADLDKPGVRKMAHEESFPS